MTLGYRAGAVRCLSADAGSASVSTLPSVVDAQDDDTIDVIRDFQLGIDLIDVSAFASDFSELDIANRTKRNGDTNWIDINDDTGETEIIFRFDSATALDAANLTADAFFFG